MRDQFKAMEKQIAALTAQLAEMQAASMDELRRAG